MPFSKPAEAGSSPTTSDKQKCLYVINGCVATAAHYAVLRALLAVLPGADAGLCNMGASLVGVTVSFFGNRFVVFRHTKQLVARQFAAYVVLYAVLALMQGLLMHLLVDRLGVTVIWAFWCCVAFQFAAGFVANKHVVFRH